MKIGVVMMLVEMDLTGRALHWEEIRSLAEQIEAQEFDSLWVYDHLLYRSGRKKVTGIWEAWSMLSALAAVTKRLEIGTLVACNSFRNPALLAKMAHTVDEISGGRLVLGLGAGWNEPEYRSFGYPFDHRVSRFEEALQIIKPLLRTGRVDFNGRYYSASDCVIQPASPRPGGPPLMIGGLGPRMRHLSAVHADLWNSCYTNTARSALPRLKQFQKTCQQAGRSLDTIEVTFTVSLAYPAQAGRGDKAQRGWLAGSAAELAREFKAYADLGASHLMIHLHPFTSETISRLAEAVALTR